MNIETLATILVIALVATFIARLLSGWSLGGVLITYLLACFGAIAGWFAQSYFNLPSYSVPFPGADVMVPIIWPALAALVVALLGARRSRPPSRALRRRRR